jgi:POT family proton-dependent oligopeptide transporter
VKRDAGFSIFYMGINLGGFIAPLACSAVALIDWHLGFGLAGLGMVIGLIQYRLSDRTLEGYGDEIRFDSEEKKREKTAMVKVLLGIGALLAFLLAMVFLGFIRVNAGVLAEWSGIVFLVLAYVYLLYVIFFGGLNTEERKKVVVIGILFVFSALFWSGFEQAGSTLNLFAERFTDRNMMGWEIPAGFFQSVNSLFIIIFAPFFGALWISLGRRNLEPNSPIKFALGLFQLGLGFLVMYFAAKIAAAGDLAAPTWLIFTYLLHTFGELSLSPVGLSLVTKLAPNRYGGQMMGVWFLSVALGNLFAGLIAGEASGGSEEAILQMPDQYKLIVMTALGAGGILLLLSVPIRKLMGNVR